MPNLRAASLFGLLLVAGCDRSGAVGNNQMAAVRPDAWAIGTWVEDVRTCQATDVYLGLAADHSYTDVGSTGNWDFSGRILSLTALRTFTMGEDDEQVVQHPRAVQYVVEARSEGRMRLRSPEGQVMDLSRCPPAR